MKLLKNKSNLLKKKTNLKDNLLNSFQKEIQTLKNKLNSMESSSKLTQSFINSKDIAVEIVPNLEKMKGKIVMFLSNHNGDLELYHKEMALTKYFLDGSLKSHWLDSQNHSRIGPIFLKQMILIEQKTATLNDNPYHLPVGHIYYIVYGEFVE